ncbi:MAG: sulfotransferase [Desulfobacter postgatei]|uniref:sulfotransferase n=1 Tax=Desulfobacter postgatei TaxID=2293 RepID=UPI0023F0F7EC|nr:sulfotransferase [Desulfobacter postgatei]MDD4273478.1 sulfotransferase [Desulfobacter postgatei]
MFTDGRFIELVSSVEGIAVSTMIAALFGFIVSRTPKSDYGSGSKLLHHLVLGNNFVGETLFDVERLLFSPDITSKKSHLFVAGLARAGTTVLMRTLYENGKFTSLTYRDMPFILAPNLWRKIAGFSRQNTEMKERAHGDGLKINYDSPEALEEVFWRTFCGSDYIKKNGLIPMTADNEILDKFKAFVGLILNNTPDNCYLSKNNNNILRLDSIARAFPNALIIVPFRDPLQQAFSLLNQHKKFLKKHSDDPFAKKYMTWLAHHEFGADHRPFIFNGINKDEEDTQNLSYWLTIWINTYSYLMNNLPPQAVFLSYENLCDKTELVWGKLSKQINLSPYTDKISFTKALHPINEPVPGDLLQKSNDIYKGLIGRSL